MKVHKSMKINLSECSVFWLNNLSTTTQLNEHKRYVVDECNSIFY